MIWLVIACSSTSSPPDQVDSPGVPCGPEVACTEDCADGVDNDQDGLVDCMDTECIGGADCFEDCADDVDNDGDGLTDCADYEDCYDICLEDCTDGVDNDRDGLVDCEDVNCRYDIACREDCGDGTDNTGNGLIDCADPDCYNQPGCIEDCVDGVDNDGDGLLDCADLDCKEAAECAEDCFDGLDNDEDGLLDCEDSDCTDICTESDCGDGEDEDLDGFTDCEDTECWGLGACPSRFKVSVNGGYRGQSSHWDYLSTTDGDRSLFSARFDFPSGEVWMYDGGGSPHCRWSAKSWEIRESTTPLGFLGSAQGNDVQLSSACTIPSESFDMSFIQRLSSSDLIWPFGHPWGVLSWSGGSPIYSVHDRETEGTLTPELRWSRQTVYAGSFYYFSGFLPVEAP